MELCAVVAVLLRHEPDPGRGVPSGVELRRVGHGGYAGRGSDRPDAGHDELTTPMRLLGHIKVGLRAISLEFGRRNLSRLFICAVHTLYGLTTERCGVHDPRTAVFIYSL